MAAFFSSLLGENPQGTRLSLCRLYYHRKLAEPIGKVLAETGLR